MKTKNIIIGVVIYFTMTIYTQAQQSINAGGNTISGAGGSVSYSIGQATYTSNIDSTGSVSQGVQQTYDITKVGLKETTLNISLTAFPNPTLDRLTLKVLEFNHKKLNYRFCDLQGKLLFSGNITTAETLLNTSGIAPATYCVYITDEQNNSIQTFKIIKR